jgi:hypothetical protein
MFKYIVKSIDIDGDHITDGDLFMKFAFSKKKGVVTAKLIKIIYLNNAEVKKFTAKIKKEYLKKVKGGSGGAVATKTKEVPSKVEFVDNASVPTQGQTSTIVVENRTSFANSITSGFGFGAGAAVGSAIAEGIMGAF